MIPIKIETLLEGRKVEQNRIEYKEGFNPSEIVHTICSYANDITGVDGGYLVIGVKTENGIPILPSVGVPNELLDDIQLKIFQYCNKIEPRYIPKIEIVEYQGVNLVYLKCAAGDAGPYQAPVDVYSKKEAYRFFNYPYNALEEALVNAVLHKNYKEDVPVEIRIYPDQIQIINFPRPDHYIDTENFA